MNQFEKEVKKALKKQYEGRSETLWAHYIDAKEYLEVQVYPFIIGAEPSLTDHTIRHIENVQKNIHHIISGQYKEFAGAELYTLALMVLFHDVGNVFGREDHNKYDVIAKVYDQKFGGEPQYTHERRVIARAAEAHSGRTADGSRDTLETVPITDNMDGDPIRLRELAAILRFADELAEGPQRTSNFMYSMHKYDQSSLIHHQYARINSILINKANERIALTYNINIKDVNGKLSDDQERDLKNILAYTYKRIGKLDEERKYARYYCSVCNAFKRTTVAINIEVNGQRTLDLSECTLNDMVVPGEGGSKSIDAQYKNYQITKIIKALNQRK